MPSRATRPCSEALNPMLGTPDRRWATCLPTTRGESLDAGAGGASSVHGASGAAHLTERERECLALMAEGRSNAGICERVVLSQRTVESHVRAIFRKLGFEEAHDDHRRVLAVLTYLRA